MTVQPDAPLTALAGVGPALAKKLERLGLYRAEDLLFLLPLRYEDRTQLVRLGMLAAGERCLVTGEVLLAETAFRGRRNLLVRIGDGSGQLTLRFFHFSRSQQAQFQPGVRVTCFGEVRKGRAGLEMIHPEYRLLRDGQDPAINDSLTAIYPATEGVQQGRLRNLTEQALTAMRRTPPEELLPDSIRRELAMPSLAEAILYLHRPPPDADIALMAAGRHPCQQRLAFEELLAHYLSLKNLRALADTESAPALDGGQDQVNDFIDRLPFRLTDAQQRVTAEILGDMQAPHPMMRLIQGDVGSGKTIVAAIACLKAMACGVQAAIMAPTELLAEQHWRSFSEWFRPIGLEPAWLAGSQKAAARREALAAIADGSAPLVVGTHALFQEGVTFNKLGLVVIDEQHRFGVHQRMALREKGIGQDGHPHQLVMTATPIPRTLAMAAYADLDVSIIDELPPGRQAVTTVAVPETRRDEIVSRVRAACATGQQAYWVCPLIEESEALDYEAAEASYEMLTAALPDIRIGLVHGRMRPAEKERGMREFKEGLTQLLVATTVIEVGVDVQSHCVLVYKPPLSVAAKTRLAVLRDTNDGFVVAQRDLELRGPGELLGTRQTGLPDYRIANLVRDAELMPRVQLVAERITRDAPAQAAAIIRRWLGDAGRYGKV